MSRELICIRIIEGASNHQYAQIGDIVVVIKEAVPNVSPEKLEIIRTVTIHTFRIVLNHAHHLMQEFYDAVLIEISLCLPPTTHIQHCLY